MMWRPFPVTGKNQAHYVSFAQPKSHFPVKEQRILSKNHYKECSNADRYC